MTACNRRLKQKRELLLVSDGCCFSVPSKTTGRCVGCTPSICLLQAVGVIICHTQLWQAQSNLVCISQCRSPLLSLTASSLLCLSLWQNSQLWEWIMSTTLLLWTELCPQKFRSSFQAPLAPVQGCGVPFRVPYKPCAVCTQPRGAPVLQEARCCLALLCS